jgi:DUF971 family protein
MALAGNKRKPKDVVYQDDLTVEWRDGVVAHYPFLYLRDVCPCASCINELTGEKMLDSKKIPADIHARSADYVGNYALRISWSDGHDTGIYSFRFLREVLDLALERGAEPGGPHVTES